MLLPGSRRRKLLVFVLILGLVFPLALHLCFDIPAQIYAIRRSKWPRKGVLYKTQPPTYDGIIQMERDLPQHNLSLPYPEGKNGRYVKFSYERPTLGWNNVLTEVCVYSSLHVFRLPEVQPQTLAYYAATSPGERSAPLSSKTISGNWTTIHGSLMNNLGRLLMPSSLDLLLVEAGLKEMIPHAQ